jgi:hypothetical protein
VGIRCADHATPLPAKAGTNFADKRRSLGRYSSLADYGHEVLFFGRRISIGKASEQILGRMQMSLHLRVLLAEGSNKTGNLFVHKSLDVASNTRHFSGCLSSRTPPTIRYCEEHKTFRKRNLFPSSGERVGGTCPVIEVSSF